MKRVQKIWICLTILCLCVIFGHSLMPASVSGKESFGIFEWLNRFLPWLTHHLVRKIAHFSAFAVLGAFLTGSFWYFKDFRLRRPLCCSLLAAFVDETIQLFVTGRSGQISDMWLDLSGALFGTITLWLILRYRKQKACKKKLDTSSCVDNLN